MIHSQLLELMSEALKVSKWDAKKGALETGLVKLCIAPLFENIDDLAGLQRLMRSHEDATVHVIKKLPTAKLRALVRKLNKHRPVAPANSTDVELVQELIALAKGHRNPDQKQTRTTTNAGGRAARRSRPVAAE